MEPSHPKSFIVDKYFIEMQKAWERKAAKRLKRGSQTGCGSRDPASISVSRDTPDSDLHQVLYGGHGKNGWSPFPENLPQQPPTTRTTGIRKSCSWSNLSLYSYLDDLVELETLLTEDSILRALQARFYAGKYYTYIGPVLVSVNPLSACPTPRALTGMGATPQQMVTVVRKAVNQLRETGFSQTILLNGVSGSGKSHNCRLLLRQVYDVVGGGTETDSFKHLSAALTVLQAMGSASTVNNQHASRMGYFIETQISGGAISRTKIHCYFLDHSRVTERQRLEKNFHIFYHMLAGLSEAEKNNYHLGTYREKNLEYLSQSQEQTTLTEENATRDRTAFEAWKSCLSILGIPLADIMRVLSAVLLLGNISFTDGATLDLQVKGDKEIKSVAALLGMSSVTLYQGLTTVSRLSRGQVFRTGADAYTANQRRDQLAKSLYARTVAAIVKRTNSCRRPQSSSVSTASTTDSHDTSFVNLPPHGGQPLSRSSSFSQLDPSGSSHSTAFVGLLDMFGFEQLETNHLEQLCINLCAETLQHFYNTHIFKTTEEACIDEGIQSDMDIHYMENAPIVELLSSQRTGVLSLLEAECRLQKGCTESYLQKVRVQHKISKHFAECPNCPGQQTFAIQHFAGRVEYDVTRFLQHNRNQLPDDVMWIFDRSNCNFGFVSHLFSHDIRAMHGNGGKPRGIHYRLVQGSSSESGSGQQTLSEDFHGKLDSLLKVLIHSKPHFIRCLKSNSSGETDIFSRETVVRQVRSYQILETLHLMAAGFPHRVKYRAFNGRYRSLVKTLVGKPEDKSYAETKVILNHFLKTLETEDNCCPMSGAQWALGKKHLFLSESAYKQLERLRDEQRDAAASVIQAEWRRHWCQRQWPALRQRLRLSRRHRLQQQTHRPTHRRRISEGDALSWAKLDSCADDHLQHTLNIYGLDMDQPPALPTKRSYTVKGNIKLGYPQTRVMKQTYSDMTSGCAVLQKGEDIHVIGVSPKPGYLLVIYGNSTIHVPYQLTELKADNLHTSSQRSLSNRGQAPAGFQVDV